MSLYRVLSLVLFCLIVISIPLIHFFKIPSAATIKSDFEIYNKGKKAKNIPKALIIGAPKCGSTGLREFLAIHPGIATIRNGEPNYFNLIQNYKKGIQWYRSKMPPSFPNQITIDKSPSYFRNEDTPKRVFKLDKNMKLILIVRDPVLRVVSHFAHLKDDEIKYFGKRNTTLEEEIFNKKGEIIVNPSKITDKNKYTIAKDFRNSLISDSLYFVHLKRWLGYFKLSQFLILDGHEFIKNPYNQVKKVENFLGLVPYFKPDHYVFDTQKGFYCVNGKVFNKTRNNLCLNEEKGRTHPVIEESTMDKIKKFLDPYSIRFFNYLKIEPYWTI